MVLVEIIEVSSFSKETPRNTIWVNVNRTLEKLYSVYYHCLKKGFNQYKYITIRPHDHLISGMYNKAGYKDLINSFKEDLLELIKYPFIGSIESNNKKFIHFHLIIKCSNKALEKDVIFKLKDKFCKLEKALEKKQYAIKLDKLINDRIRMFFMYRLGYSVHKGRMKDSYIAMITNDYELYTESLKTISIEDMNNMLAIEEYEMEKIHIQKIKHQFRENIFPK